MYFLDAEPIEIIEMDVTGTKILIVDDDADLLDMLAYSLRKEGYTIETAEAGAEALKKLKADRPDLVILDVMLPYMSGLEICEIIRKDDDLHDLPVLMLSARAMEYDEVAGLESGADDYLVKPVSIRLLSSRLRALLRRTHVPEDTQEETDLLRIGPLEIDRARYVVRREDQTIHLPRKEFELLYLLATRPGVVFPRQKILDQVWGHDISVNERTIDVHIRKIRKRLQNNALIETVKGVGYKLKQGH